MDKIKDKINEYLKSEDLTIEDLTKEEIGEVKEVIEAEEKGYIVLDGFDPLPVHTRKLEKEFEQQSEG